MNISKFDEEKNIEDFSKIDCMNRQQLIENLYQLIYATQSSLVISVEAPWGYGKTFFAKYCEAEFRKKGALTAYFNAWESDYSEDPFIVFFDEISKLLEKECGLDRISEKFKEVGIKIIKYSLPLVVKLLTNGLIDISFFKNIFKGKLSNDDISSALQKIAEEELAAYQNKRKSITEFKNTLSEIVSSIQINKKKVFTIFIDELDRCRPNYAIELIENIKHIFNINGITFILFLDFDQLKKSLKVLYGDIDVDGYLKRFFDYRVFLPEPELKTYSEYLFSEYKLENVLDQQKTGNIPEWFAFFSEPFDISLRDLQKIFYEFNIILSTYFASGLDTPAILIMLIFLKHKKIETYKAIQKSEFRIRDLDIIYGKENYETSYIKHSSHWQETRLLLMLNLMSDVQLQNEIIRLRRIILDGSEKIEVIERAKKAISILSDSTKRNYYKNHIQDLIIKIDFVEKYYRINNNY